MGDRRKQALRVQFEGKLKLEFHGGKIRRKLTFRDLRKSCLTAPSNDRKEPARAIDLLAGHSSGIKENYVVKKNVQRGCEAIERHYFGGNR